MAARHLQSVGPGTRNDHFAEECRDDLCGRLPCRMYKKGYEAGYRKGYADGYGAGYAAGYGAGYSAGYGAGFSAGAASSG